MDALDENKNPQIQPIRGEVSTEKLRAMKAADAAAEFEKVLDSMTDVDCDMDVIDAYLEVLEEKASAPPSKDSRIVYAEIQRRVENLSVNGDGLTHQSEGNSYEQSRQGKHFELKKVVMVSVATVCLMFALMIGAQASGLNVFGYLAQWTSEKFSFVVNPGQGTEPQYLTEFREILEQHEIPAELAPTWIPEGFRTDGPVYDDENPFCDSIRLQFFHDDGREFRVCVDRYSSPEDIGEGLFEKDTDDVERYISNERAFYIFSNINTVTAAWSEGAVVETVSGSLTVEETRKIIDSIGR